MPHVSRDFFLYKKITTRIITHMTYYSYCHRINMTNDYNYTTFTQEPSTNIYL